MERHRNDEPIFALCDQRRHVAGHRSRDCDLAAIFEPNRESARQIVIGDCSARPCNSRRPCKAGAASRLLGRLERQPAGLATRMAEKLDLFPAIGAKAVNLGDDRAATRTAGRQGKIERPPRNRPEHHANHSFLSLGKRRRTSARVAQLFDMKLRALRRDRAAKIGTELFLYERAFADCVDRLALVQRRFDQALLIGSPDPSWRGQLQAFANEIEIADPSPFFAARSGGRVWIEDAWEPEEGGYDLVLAVGTLDTVNGLPIALRLIRHALCAGGLFLGAFSGGDTLPQLRNAMRAADAVTGAAAPHVHPRIEAAALAPLLDAAGFIDTVVDVDRAAVSYVSLESLVADLRAMGTTNLLTARPRFIGRAARDAAIRAFAAAGDGLRTVEKFEILHFAAWRGPEG